MKSATAATIAAVVAVIGVVGAVAWVVVTRSNASANALIASFDEAGEESKARSGASSSWAAALASIASTIGTAFAG